MVESPPNLMSLLYENFFTGSPQFSSLNLPDMSGRVAIVTGGSSGCGYEIAKGLLLHNAHVYIASRGEAKAHEAIALLRKELNPAIKVDFLPLDLGELASIKKSVKSFLAKESRLDYLVNNAGVMVDKRKTTVDGHEYHFGINVIGTYVFTELLLDILQKTAKMDESKLAYPTGVRVAFLSSSLMHVAPKELIPLNDMPSLNSEKYNMLDLYSISKAGDCALACYYARVLKDTKIIVTSSHPGMIQTNIQETQPLVARITIKILGYPQQYGAITVLYSLVSPDLKGGEYLVNWCRVGTPRSQVNDEEFQDELVAYCREEAFKFKAM